MSRLLSHTTQKEPKTTIPAPNQPRNAFLPFPPHPTAAVSSYILISLRIRRLSLTHGPTKHLSFNRCNVSDQLGYPLVASPLRHMVPGCAPEVRNLLSSPVSVTHAPPATDISVAGMVGKAGTGGAVELAARVSPAGMMDDRRRGVWREDSVLAADKVEGGAATGIAAGAGTPNSLLIESKSRLGGLGLFASGMLTNSLSRYQCPFTPATA